MAVKDFEDIEKIYDNESTHSRGLFAVYKALGGQHPDHAPMLPAGGPVKVKFKGAPALRGVVTEMRIDTAHVGESGQQCPGLSLTTLTIVIEG